MSIASGDSSPAAVPVVEDLLYAPETIPELIQASVAVVKAHVVGVDEERYNTLSGDIPADGTPFNDAGYLAYVPVRLKIDELIVGQSDGGTGVLVVGIASEENIFEVGQNGILFLEPVPPSEGVLDGMVSFLSDYSSDLSVGGDIYKPYLFREWYVVKDGQAHASTRGSSMTEAELLSALEGIQ